MSLPLQEDEGVREDSGKAGSGNGKQGAEQGMSVSVGPECAAFMSEMTAEGGRARVGAVPV